MDAINLHDYEKLSPFEIKDELTRLARTSGQASAHMYLNAGRGNPNWIATRAREIFFRLGQFATSEAKRDMTHSAGLAGMPRADRLDTWLERPESKSGTERVDELIRFALDTFSFQPDAFVHELIDAIMACAAERNRKAA